MARQRRGTIFWLLLPSITSECYNDGIEAGNNFLVAIAINYSECYNGGTEAGNNFLVAIAINYNECYDHIYKLQVVIAFHK